VQKPEIMAPGHYVVAAWPNTWSYRPNEWWTTDGKHCTRFGTSVAAAHVAGAIALSYQRDTSYDFGQQMTYLETYLQRTDAWSSPKPNNNWGHGQLDLGHYFDESAGHPQLIGDDPLTAYAPPFPVYHTHALGEAVDSVMDGPQPANNLRIDFAISQEDVTATNTPEITITSKATGFHVRTLYGTLTTSPQVVAWDGLDSAGNPAPAGFYAVRVGTGDRGSYSTVELVRQVSS
jgi:hypothetical protein